MKDILQQAAAQYEDQARVAAEKIADLIATVANRDAQISELNRDLGTEKARGDRAELELTARERTYTDLASEMDALALAGHARPAHKPVRGPLRRGPIVVITLICFLAFCL